MESKHEQLGPILIYPDWVADKIIEFVMAPKELEKARRNFKPFKYIKQDYSKCLVTISR